ncbi:SpoIID/LytB domain-containing protein [Fervidobacterium islandicum]|uniref:SpoIID/LytB domain-containing protein n=1 Tax=Fervidobacterium islandicum TaxID=2423 RepID=UPI003A6330AD
MNKQVFILIMLLLSTILSTLLFGQEIFTLNVSLVFPNDNDTAALMKRLDSNALSYLYKITILDANHSETLLSSSPILSLSIAKQGTYEIEASVISGSDVYFSGKRVVVVDYSSFIQEVEIPLIPIVSRIFVTFDNEGTESISGERIIITDDSSNVVLNESLNEVAFPLFLNVIPGTYKLTILNEENLTQNSINRVLSATELNVQPGQLYPVMISLRNQNIILKKNSAKVSKLTAFDVNTREVIFEKEGRFKLARNLSINGKTSSAWSSLLFPGLSDLYLTFSNGEITNIDYKEEFPSRVRVLISSELTTIGGLSSATFEKLTLKISNGYSIFSFREGYCQITTMQHGQIVRFSKKSDGLIIETNDGIIGPFETNTRFYLKAQARDSSVEISEKSKNKYFGDLEIFVNKSGGFSIINDLPIEEYLKSVVASEMPSTYHLEALKAQAVVARTYALEKILSDRRYAGLGANMDDSTNFQAYNFQKPNEKSSLAVERTNGEVLLYKNKLSATFYYSVSGGYVMDPKDIFKMSIAYLKPKVLSVDQQNLLFLDDELALKNFLKNWDILTLQRLGFPEARNGYFRWKVEFSADEIYSAVISLKNVAAVANNTNTNEKSLKAIDPVSELRRYVNSQLLSSLRNDTLSVGISELTTDFSDKIVDQSTSPAVEVKSSVSEEKLTQDVTERIIDVYVSARTPGRYVTEITIETNKRIFKIASSDVTRVFSVKGKKITLLNGIIRSDLSSLPSSFFTVDVVKNEEGFAQKIVLYGGGFGHGIGMSQVAANVLAKDFGWDYITILSFFYTGTQLRKVY